MSFPTAVAWKRAIATPGTIALFVVSTVTGIMLLFHWQGSLVHFSHEWLSVAFSAIAVWHLLRNWQAFRRYLASGLAVGVLAVILLVSAGVTAMTGTVETSGGGVSPRAVFHALEGTSLAAVAPAFGLTSEEALAALSAKGLVASADQTVSAIAAANGTAAPVVTTLLATARPR